MNPVRTQTPDAAARHLGFSYEALTALIREFAESVPALLSQHRETAELALAVERLGLVESLQTRFTVAIIGQMRVGKSTLLNALIGRRLAPTGVNETTATVNWFRYGEGEQCERFRVHWQDGSSEDQPLAAVNDWLGQSEQAGRVQALDFFAEAEFLRLANIVDTPGTRSVLDSHESAVRGFLAERLETETLYHGGRADAILYVINPVARQDDRELLAVFEQQSRLPGASAYNSLAVVQKWEHLDDGGDPLQAVRRKCLRLRQQLEGKVAEVIPVSGMLALLVAEQPPAVWQSLAELATASRAEVLEDLLLSDGYFVGEQPQAPCDSRTRQALLDRLSWPAVRFCLQLAQRERIDQGAVLRQQVHAASGIERLQQVLQERFFALSGLIKAGTVLRKAWQPCDQALLTLRDLTERRQDERRRADQAAEVVRGLLESTPVLGSVLDYVADSMSAVENERQRLEANWIALDRIRTRAEHSFRFLDEDLAGLELLERLGAEAISEAAERTELQRLFGGEGPDIHHRLGLVPDAPLDAAVVDRVWDRRDAWAVRRGSASRELNRIIEHALDCLDRILDYLEDQPSI